MNDKNEFAKKQREIFTDGKKKSEQFTFQMRCPNGCKDIPVCVFVVVIVSM